jgi:hypothetical protein
VGPRGALAPLALACALACAPARPPGPSYDPAASVLEVVSVLRRHVPDDTYRFPPARDFTGRNLYRASLLRLENLEQAHADALRAGHLDDVIAFAKGRALERLRAFDLAASSYRRAARSEGPLAQPALRGAALCDAFAEAASIAPAGALEGTLADSEAILDAHAMRVELLEALRADTEASHYAAILAEEIEAADLDRAHGFLALRSVLPEGDVRAIGELQRVVVTHRESKNANRHLLELADLYATLASEYVDANPPEGLRFDPPGFQDLVDSASRLYEAVANQDGTTEKLEAERRLEAFLAFTLRVDRDRFSR